MNEEEVPQEELIAGELAEVCVKCIICNLAVAHIVDDMRELLAIRCVPDDHRKERFVGLLEEAERAAEAAREYLLSILE